MNDSAAAMSFGGTSTDLDNRQIWLIVGGLMVGMFLQGLDTLLIVTALPTIAGELGGLDRISWALTVYLLTQTASVPLWGKLGDIWGRKRLYQFAVVLFAVTSVLCALAQNVDQLIAARAIRGVAGGGLLVLPFAIVGDIVPARRRARYQGAMGANVAVATLLGPLLGGFFVDHASWRYAFLVGVPPAGLALWSTRRLRLPSSRISRVGVDFTGAGIVVTVSVSLLLLVTWGGRRFSWASPQTLGLAVLSMALLAVLVAWERHAEDPIVPLHLFKIKGFPLLMSAAFFSGIAMQAPWTVMPIFLQLITGASATSSGLLLLPLIISISIASFIGGHLMSRSGRCKMVIVTGMILATCGFSFYLLLDRHSSRLQTSLFMTVTGCGLGLIIQPLVVVTQAMAPQRELGAATSVVSFFRQLGQAFGTAIALAVFAGRLVTHLRSNLSASTYSALDDDVRTGSPKAVERLEFVVRDPVTLSFARALHDTFVAVIPFAVIGLAMFALIPRVHLHDEERSFIDVLEPAP